MLENLPTPTLLIDGDRLDANIARMQAICDAHRVELRPHIKTHKMLEVARRQLAAGAAGLTCAKLSEAEVMVHSGARSIFVAHSLVDPLQAPRLRALALALDELFVGCTSLTHAEALEALLARAELRLPVMMALDTGLGREGARDKAGAVQLAAFIRAQPHLDLRGIYTHEGQLYGVAPEQADAAIARLHAQLLETRDAIDPALKLWPGCSATAARMAALPGVDAVRPGAYPLGDLALTDTTGVMEWSQVAISVLATVIDRPQPGLALIDAGSKVFSSDKTAQGLSGRALDGRDLQVIRCNEEHGYLGGTDVDALKVGERVRFVPAHVCTAINLANTVTVLRDDGSVATWTVEARGCVT